MRDQHDQVVRAHLARYRGREVKTMGDGFLATFDGPARAVRCAQAIVAGVDGLGIEVRAGLHTGEVELDGDDVSGIAVAIGARVGAVAEPSEVLVSQTIKDLTAGSGIVFADRGERELKASPIAGRPCRATAQPLSAEPAGRASCRGVPGSLCSRPGARHGAGVASRGGTRPR